MTGFRAVYNLQRAYDDPAGIIAPQRHKLELQRAAGVLEPKRSISRVRCLQGVSWN